MVCEEGFKNQVCPECLGQHIESWLVDYRQDLIEKFNKVGFSLDSNMRTGVFCTVCRMEMAVCQKCFFSEVKTFLQDERSMIEDTFAEQFVMSRI